MLSDFLLKCQANHPGANLAYCIGKAGELGFDAGHVVTKATKAKSDEPAAYHDFIATKQVEDRDGDVVMVAGCRLDNYKANPVVLWNHKADIPDYVLGLAEDNGQCTVKMMSDRVTLRCHYDLDREFPRAVSRMVEKGILRGMSIGFKVLPGGVTPREGYRGHVVNEWEMLENSITPLPTNQQALRSELSKGYSAIVTKAFEPWLPRTKVISIPGADPMAKKKAKPSVAEPVESCACHAEEKTETPVTVEEEKAFPPKKKPPQDDEQEQQKPPQAEEQEQEPPAEEEEQEQPPQPQAGQQPVGQQTDEGMQDPVGGGDLAQDGMGGQHEDLRPGVSFLTMLHDALEASIPVQEEPMRAEIKKIEALCAQIGKKLYPGLEFGFASGGDSEEEMPEELDEENGDEEEEPFSEESDEDRDGAGESEDEEAEDSDDDEENSGPPKKKKPPFKSMDFDKVNEALSRVENQFVSLTGRRL